jgi:dTDP-glucose 4,6-dehydratase
MKYLVTGGRGFVGSYVIREILSRGEEVTVLSNLSHPSPNTIGMEFQYGDIRYEYDVRSAVKEVDCVIHLAAKINVDRSRESARPFVDTNIIGTYNILEACREYGKKLICASTSEALGTMLPQYEMFGMSETHPYRPDNPYGATKAAADMLIIGWQRSYDMDITILRSFNITGVGQAYDKEGAFIPKTIEKIINDENPVIFGSGNQTRDYVWAGDVAKAYLLLANGNYKGELYHVGTGTEQSIEYVAQKLIDISGKSLKIEYIAARPKEVKRLKCDFTKLSALGWKPTKGIDEVLQDMYEYRLAKELE